MTRKYAITRKERKSFGGSFDDSFTWASKFQTYHPTDFGIMGAQLYSSEPGSHVVNKPFIWHTLAQGNVYETDPGVTEYKWALYDDINFRATITKVDANLGSYPGKAGSQFKFYLDVDHFHEPVVMKTEGTHQPMIKIIGLPKYVGAEEYAYIGVIQDGDPTSYVDPAYLQVGRTMVDATTQVSDELNYKYGGLQYGNMFSLQSNIGFVARKFEMTDKAIRLEIGARKSGSRLAGNYTFAGKAVTDGIGVGYFYGKTSNGVKEIKAGGYVTAADAMLEDRVMLDCEYAMMFGRLQHTMDVDSSRPISSPPGWLQLVRDGFYQPHSGNLTLSDFYEFLNAQFTTRKDFMERKTVIRAGSGGLEFFSRLIALYAGLSPFTVVDSFFIERVSAQHTDKALRFGAQFTQVRMPNGHIIEVGYDPNKDDQQWFYEKAAGTNYTKESFSFDIYDLGETDAAPAKARTKSNLAFVMDPSADEYFTVSNVYDFETGSEKSGGNKAQLNKEAGIYRAKSFALAAWDTSRIARWEYIGE